MPHRLVFEHQKITFEFRAFVIRLELSVASLQLVSTLSSLENAVIAIRTNSCRIFLASVLLTGLVVSWAQGAPPERPVSRSQHALEIARLRFKLYERVDYPIRQRQLRTEITLMEARVSSLQRRVKEAERFRQSEALFTTIENLRLELLEAELLLKDWKHELSLLKAHHQDERRLHQLLIQNAATPVQVIVP